jgi:regulator of sirC expression with transglutaminase-like and TPR domain
VNAPLSREFSAVVADEPFDLARAALVIAKLEYPNLDVRPSLARLAELGDQARAALEPVAGAPTRIRIGVLNELLFTREGFAGNRANYGDYRNSLLNVVLARRLGIPISLAVVYMDVARRAGLSVFGIAFPGHFLLRVPDDDDERTAVILDPFDQGKELDERDCRALLVEHMGEDAIFVPAMLQPCTPRQLLARMLNNLKRTYVESRSFPQARATTDMMLAADPTLLSELRDRGLLSYHLDDFPAALRDLEDYVRLHAWSDEEDKEEREEIWNHVKTLRKRVAGFN